MAKFSENELTVLGHVELNVRASISAIARACKLKEHIVRNVIHKHTQSGLLKERAFINPYKLGLSSYAILLSFRGLSSELSQQIVKRLMQREGVVTVIELGGQYSYQVELFVKNPHDLHLFYEWLGTEFGELLQEKQIALQSYQHIFGFKFGTQFQREVKEVAFGLSSDTVELDSLDLSVMALLEETTTSSTIGRKLGIASTTIDFRMKRLLANGVIQGFVYEMTGPKLGLNSFFVHLSAKNFSQRLRQSLHDFGYQHPHITFFNVDIGNWDFKFGVSAPTQEAVRSIEEKIQSNFGASLLRLETIPRFNTHKASGFPFSVPATEQRKIGNL